MSVKPCQICAEDTVTFDKRAMNFQGCTSCIKELIALRCPWDGGERPSKEVQGEKLYIFFYQEMAHDPKQGKTVLKAQRVFLSLSPTLHESPKQFALDTTVEEVTKT